LITTLPLLSLFVFNDPSTTDVSTLSLHDALPIWPFTARWAPKDFTSPRASTAQFRSPGAACISNAIWVPSSWNRFAQNRFQEERSEEHTSELQSRENLVCRLLLEKKKKIKKKRKKSNTTNARKPPSAALYAMLGPDTMPKYATGTLICIHLSHVDADIDYRQISTT